VAGAVQDPDAVAHVASPANPRLKKACRLRDRRHRDDSGLMIVEGCREIRLAVESGCRPRELFFCRDRFTGAETDILDACRAAGADLVECEPAAFEKIAYRDHPEGLLAVVPMARRTLSDLSIPDHALLVVVEAIEKPGNLGTILRTADAAGVHGVVVCDRCTDLGNPNVVRASLGTLFTVPVAEASSAEAVRWLRDRGVRILAATPHAATLYTRADMTRGTAIALGSEQDGLSDTWLQAADECVRIPMLGRADSLNVSASATLLLYEAVRQRGVENNADTRGKEPQ
jgi:TrmH family RNA methyltransferase